MLNDFWIFIMGMQLRPWGSHFFKAQLFTTKGQVKIHGVPGPGPLAGGKDVFFEKIGGPSFTKKFENSRFISSKRLFLKVEKLGQMLGQVTLLCSLAYGAYNKYMKWFSQLYKAVFERNKKGG